MYRLRDQGGQLDLFRKRKENTYLWMNCGGVGAGMGKTSGEMEERRGLWRETQLQLRAL